MLTVKQALEIAIKSETRAKDLYLALVGRVSNLMLRDKLAFLAGEEQKHYDMLTTLFREKIGGTPGEPDPALLPRLEIELDFERAELTDLWQAAMRAEEIAAEHYEKLTGMLEGRAVLIFNYLANVERSHYFLLKSEYEVLSELDEYSRTADFPFGLNMINLGP